MNTFVEPSSICEDSSLSIRIPRFRLSTRAPRSSLKYSLSKPSIRGEEWAEWSRMNEETLGFEVASITLPDTQQVPRLLSPLSAIA